MRVKHRITCDEQGYPFCESRYGSVADWEKEHKRNWIELWLHKYERYFKSS